MVKQNLVATWDGELVSASVGGLWVCCAGEKGKERMRETHPVATIATGTSHWMCNVQSFQIDALHQ